MSLFRKEGPIKLHKYDYKDVKYLRDKWTKNMKNLSLCRENVVGKNDSYDIKMIKKVLRELNIMVRAGKKARVDHDDLANLNSNLFEAQVSRGGRGPLHSDLAQRRSLDVNPSYTAKITVRDLIAINKNDIQQLRNICRKLQPLWGKVDTLKIIGGKISFIDGDLVDVIDNVDFSIAKLHKSFSVVCSNDAKVQKFRGFLRKKGSRISSRVVQESDIMPKKPLKRKISKKTKKKKELGYGGISSDEDDDDDYYDDDDDECYEFLHDFNNNMITTCLFGRYGTHLFRFTDIFVGYMIGIFFVVTIVFVTAAFTVPFFFFKNQWFLGIVTGSSGLITCLFCFLCWGLCSGLRSGFLGGYIGYFYNLCSVIVFSFLSMAQPIIYFVIGRLVLKVEWNYIQIVFYSFFCLTVSCLICCLCCSVTKLARIPFTRYPTRSKGVIRFGYETIN